MERTFGMLKGRFIMPHARLNHNLHMFAQHVHC